MKIPLYRSVALGIGSVFLGLALIIFLAYGGIQKLQIGSWWMEHTYRVLQALQKIQLDLKDAETKADGYLLTRNGTFLKPCWRSLAQAGRDLQFVRQETSEDALPPGILDQLEMLIGGKTQAIKEALRLAQNGRIKAAVSLLQDNQEKKIDGEIQSLVRHISRVETWLMRVRQDSEKSSTEKTFSAITASGLSALAVSLFAFLFIRRQIRRRQWADKLLQSSEEKSKALAEVANDAFITFDHQGTIVDTNPAVETMLGYLPTELAGRPLLELLSRGFLEKEGERAYETFISMTNLGHGVNAAEMELRKKDGEEIAVEISLAAWKTKDGDFFTAITRGISDRKFFTKTLLENEHRLFQFLEIVPVGIFVLDGAGQPYYANQAAKEMMGKGVLYGTPTGQLSEAYQFYAANSNGLYPVNHLPLVRALRGEKSRLEDIEIRRGDRVIPLEMWGAPIFGENGMVKYAVAAFADVTDQKSAQKTMVEGEKRFEAVTDNASDAIILSNDEGKIIYFNKVAERTFGYGKEEIMGQPFSWLLPERLQKIHRDGIERFPGLEGPETVSPWVELMGRRKDKTEIPMEMSSSSWKTEAGIFFTKVLRDVTDRKQAERMLQEREEMFRNLFEEGPIGMTLVDRNLQFINVNQAFCRMLGSRKKDLVGQFFQAFTDPEDTNLEKNLTDKLFDGLIPNYHIEKRYITKSGEVIWCKQTVSVVLDTQGKPLHRLAIVENITELKAIEEMKSSLISVVSHQLKTPVGEINGYIENMLEGLAGELSVKQREYLTDMREIGLDNYRLISDLLNVSRIERGVISVDLQPVQAGKMVELAVRDYETSAQKKGLGLSLEGANQELMLYVDKDKTVETLRNLINNALKCTDKGSITVTIKDEGENGVIEVRDTGIGMSPETIGRLFTKSRVLGKEAGRAGAGLGLFIAKSFMSLQNGDLTAVSELGKGSCFRLTVPKSKERQGAVI